MGDPKLRSYVEAGRPFPPWDRQPRLDPFLALVYEAFAELATCRPSGMNGEGRIPWTAIMEYADRGSVADWIDPEKFRVLIRAMDDAYLAHAREGREAAREANAEIDDRMREVERDQGRLLRDLKSRRASRH